MEKDHCLDYPGMEAYLSFSLANKNKQNIFGYSSLFKRKHTLCVLLTKTEQKCLCCRAVETGSSSVQSLSLSDSHLAELDGDTLRLFGLGALEALERGWGVQTAAAVTVITFRYISFDAIVPTLPRIRVKFPNLLVIWAVWDNILYIGVLVWCLQKL